MATVYEIIQGLSQAAANGYDGALDENGEAVKVGLQREEGRPMIDKRVMDGFNINFNGNMMCLGYHSEVQLREVYANGFEQEVEQRIADVVKFLKKDAKCSEATGYCYSSRVRSWVTASMYYKVGGLSEDMTHNVPSEDRLDDSFRKFLDQGGWNGKGGKRPDNDSRKKES